MTNNELSDREIKETTPFTTVSKGTQCLRINLPKERNSLQWENYTTLLKGAEGGTNRWKDKPAHGLEELAWANCSHSRDDLQSHRSVHQSINGKLHRAGASSSSRLKHAEDPRWPKNSWWGAKREAPPTWNDIVKVQYLELQALAGHKRTHRPVEQGREPRKKATALRAY